MAPPPPPTRRPARRRRRDRRQQRSVADQVRVAADRRGEVAVAGELQARVPEVARVVVGLLQRPQHEPVQSTRPAPAARSDPLTTPAPTPPPPPRPPAAASTLRRHRRRRHPQRLELIDQPLDRRPVGPLVHSVQRRHARLRSRTRATCSFAAIIRYSISRCDSVCATIDSPTTFPVRSNSNSGSAPSKHDRGAARPSRPRSAAAARAAAKAGPHGSAAPGTAGEHASRPPRTSAACPSGSPTGSNDARAHRRAHDVHLDRHGQPVLPRHQRAGIVRQRPREHRLDGARDVDARPAPVGLAIDRASAVARSAETSAMWTHTRHAPVVQRPRRDRRRRSRAPLAGSIVNVGKRAQVAAPGVESASRSAS